MPSVILSSFGPGLRSCAPCCCWACCMPWFLVVLGLCSVVDGGRYPRLYLLGEGLSTQGLQDSGLDAALLLAIALSCRCR